MMEQATSMQDEMGQVAAWQKAAATTVETHSLELQKVRDECDSRERRLSSTEMCMRRVELDISKVQDVLGSLNRRFDKSLAGLGRSWHGSKQRTLSPVGSNNTAVPSGASSKVADFPASSSHRWLGKA